MSERWARWAPMTGVVFVALLVVTIVTTGSTPDSGATGPKVISFFKDHRSSQLTGNFVGSIGVVSLVCFVATLRSRLRASGPEGLVALGFGGGLIMGVGGGLFSGLGFALADVPDKLDPAAAQALNVLSNDLFFPFAVGLAVFMIGNGLTIALRAALPRWLGWVAILIAVVGMTPLGMFSFFGALAWVLIVSLLLLWRGSRSATAGGSGRLDTGTS